MKTLHLFHRVVLTAAHQAGLLLAHEVETPGVDKPRSKSPAFYAYNKSFHSLFTRFKIGEHFTCFLRYSLSQPAAIKVCWYPDVIG